jgi:hypothetical protein
MNERIRELAEQAKLQLDQDIKDGKKDWKNTPQSYDQMVQEKFAELIVRECAEICEGEAIFAGMNGRKDASASNCATTIKQHFGVEE